MTAKYADGYSCELLFRDGSTKTIVFRKLVNHSGFLCFTTADDVETIDASTIDRCEMRFEYPVSRVAAETRAKSVFV